MPGKLDQSLDEILSTRRKTGGRGRGRRVPNAATRITTAAPVGGVQKTTKVAKRGGAKAVVPNGPAAGTGDSKIIVSNLVSRLVTQFMDTSLTIQAFRCG